jgi:subtilase family serine protease
VNVLLRLMAPLLAVLTITACNAGGNSNVPVSVGASRSVLIMSNHIPVWAAKHQARAVCPQVVGRPACLALQVTKGGKDSVCSPPSGCGFTPQQLEAAYGLTKKLANGSGTKVALIEVGDLAAASIDLSTYRSEFNLGTGNLVKYNEYGQQGNYPPGCSGWCPETALDMDMVSSSCPKCTIYLMEANSSSTSDLETTEAEAVTLGATILSNSWDCHYSWDCQDPNFPSYFDTPGITYLASSGDSGYDSLGSPSVLRSVIAVGGTQLEANGSNFTESIWSDAAAGCAMPDIVGSPGVPKPSWQHDPSCSYRTVADISAQSGCLPGVAVYLGDSGYGGWTSLCGTSVSSPLLAGVVALAGNGTNLNAGQYFWSFTGRKRQILLHYISSGNDGNCGGTYLCIAGTHQYKTYSGPGGWGTPKTIKAL